MNPNRSAAPLSHGRVTVVRLDSELAGLDVAEAIRSGLGSDGEARHALFTEAAIAAAIEAEALAVGPYPVGFLASFVRAGGVAAALRLEEPLIGGEPTALARCWLEAALAAGAGVAQDQMFARWLQMVATLLAARRNAAASRLAGSTQAGLPTAAAGSDYGFTAADQSVG